MNSRERLEDIADFAEGNPRGDGLVALSKIDAAALRELDQLLADMVKVLIDAGHGDSGGEKCLECEFVQRASQAGYGEK